MPAPKTDRREFLTRTTAAAAVLGFPFVGRAAAGAGDAAPADRPPIDYAALFTKARARMQAEHKPGVVIVIPPGEDDAAALELALSDTLLPTSATNGQRSATGRLFSRAVFVALPQDEVRKALPGADAEALCLILDAAGNVLEPVPAPARLADAGAKPRPTAALGPTFVADMNTRLDGPEGRRLAADAKSQRAALADGGKKVDRLLDLLADGSERTRELAAQGLAEQAATTAAILLEKRRTAEPELALRIDNILVTACGGVPVAADSPGMPLGVQCREAMVMKDPCPTCGMGRAAPVARRFLRFLGSPEAVVAAAAKAAP